jgi:two-component system cell cycle response regulator DivK
MAGELILIVEDNEANRRLARDLLSVHGYRTIEAETGEDAVLLAEMHAPDLVLMDIRLPGISGIEALAGLRAGAARTTPVIAASASVMPLDRSEIMQAGFDAFVAKPIGLDALVETIRETLARAQTRSGR